MAFPQEGLDLPKTVVKHEAFAVSKASGRSLASEESLAHQPDERAWTELGRIASCDGGRHDRLRPRARAVRAHQHRLVERDRHGFGEPFADLTPEVDRGVAEHGFGD